MLFRNRFLLALMAISLASLSEVNFAEAVARPGPRSGSHLRHKRARFPGCQESPRSKAKLGANTEAKSASVDLRVQQGLLDSADRIAQHPATQKFNQGTVVVTDGFRTCGRNRKTRGSAKNSAHLRGNAIDIRSRGSSSLEYANAIQAAGLHGGGFYNTCRPHVHMDTEHRGFSNECRGKGKFKRKKAKRPKRAHRTRGVRR